MISIRTIISCIGIIAMYAIVSVSGADDVVKDIQLGMQGLMEASKDPAVLAQLLKDMQDPELMAEAKAMMNNPEYIKKMKEIQNTKDYQDAVKKTKETLSDPTKAAHAEAKLEHMAKVGNEQLKKNAASAMEQAMDAIKQDPTVMADMLQMLKDPAFKEQMASLTKDSQFQTYIEAMKTMMQDPEKRRQVEEISATVKSQIKK